jgi:hypothetical protein
MRVGQRTEYFLSIWICCWLLFFTLCGTVVPDEQRWLGALCGFAVGIACALPFLLWKLWQVKKSIARTSATAQPFNN